MNHSRSVQLTSSPLLASKTPVWRSKLIVAAMALGFLGLVGRAAHVQVIDNDFFLRQGEVRFARSLELPANRGRVLDRNGVLLASSVPAPSIWANPEDLERDPLKLLQLARLLEMTPAELEAEAQLSEMRVEALQQLTSALSGSRISLPPDDGAPGQLLWHSPTYGAGQPLLPTGIPACSCVCAQ